MVLCFDAQCDHKSGYSKNRVDTCKFFNFPMISKEVTVESIRQAGWGIVIDRRSDRLPRRGDQLCSCHFEDGKKENLPTIFPRSKVSAKRRRKVPSAEVLAQEEQEDMRLELELQLKTAGITDAEYVFLGQGPGGEASSVAKAAAGDTDDLGMDVSEAAASALVEMRQSRIQELEEQLQQSVANNQRVRELEQRLEEQNSDMTKLQTTLKLQREELKVQWKKVKDFQDVVKLRDAFVDQTRRHAADLAVTCARGEREKDELSQQLAAASGQLQQERTNNRQLKAELDRIKGRKRKEI